MRSRFLLGLLFLQTAVVAAHQADPAEMQARAVRRIDAFVDHFRKTGDFQSRLADLLQADAELAASNETFTGRGDWKALATGLIKRGSILRMRGQWEEAIALYGQAEEVALRAGDMALQADALAWRALAESSRKNLGPAEDDAARAVRLAEATGDVDALTRALDILAIARIEKGDFAGAAETLSREIAVGGDARDPMTLYYAHLNRSDVYGKLAERCDAQRNTQPCYKAIERARIDLQQAIAIAKRLDYAGLVRQTENFVRELQTRLDLIRTQVDMKGALRKSAVFHPREAKDVLVTERFVAPPGEVPPELLAEQRAQSSAPSSGSLAARRYYNDAMISQMQGDNDRALSLLLKAVDGLELDRNALRDERTRGRFLDDRIGIYYAAANQLLERRQHHQAFDMIERSRSRALADLLASRAPGLERAQEQKLFAQLMMLRTKIADAQGRLFEYVSSSDRGAADPHIRSLQDGIRTLEAQHDVVSLQVEMESPRLSNLVTSKPSTLAEFQQALRKDGYEALQYVALDDALMVWYIGPTTVAVRNVFLPRSELVAKVAALRDSLRDRNAAFDESTARELFLYLLAPVLPFIRGDRLVILPHEDLNYIPFQILQEPVSSQYAGERFQFTYVPGASVFLRMRPSPGLEGSRLLALADPDIPAGVDEVEAIGRLFPGEKRVEATSLPSERDVKDTIGNYDVIHLAVHGQFDGGEPLLSHLALRAGSGDDGRLTAAEMFGLPLARSRLVVLSACETGRTEATHANEVVGMVRALIYAGAGTLVLSHWQVDSAATAVWMQAFYEAGKSRPLTHAARAALVKVKSIPEYRHPYYWAAFTMIGR